MNDKMQPALTSRFFVFCAALGQKMEMSSVQTSQTRNDSEQPTAWVDVVNRAVGKKRSGRQSKPSRTCTTPLRKPPPFQLGKCKNSFHSGQKSLSDKW